MQKVIALVFIVLSTVAVYAQSETDKFDPDQKRAYDMALKEVKRTTSDWDKWKVYKLTPYKSEDRKIGPYVWMTYRFKFNLERRDDPTKKLTVSLTYGMYTGNRRIIYQASFRMAAEV